MPKKVVVGVVTSDKMARTRVVEIPRLVKHAKYGKYLRKKTVCYVHDEGEQAHAGDTVEIMECRPRSRTKRWELVRVLVQVGVAGTRAEREEALESELGTPAPETTGQEAQS